MLLESVHVRQCEEQKHTMQTHRMHKCIELSIHTAYKEQSGNHKWRNYTDRPTKSNRYSASVSGSEIERETEKKQLKR